MPVTGGGGCEQEHIFGNISNGSTNGGDNDCDNDDRIGSG